MTNPKRTFNIAVFVGTRPEAVKLAPVIRALRNYPDFSVSTVLSGQHDQLPVEVLHAFGIEPDAILNVLVKEQSLADLTSRCLTQFESWLGSREIDFAVVQGDTTTAMTAALTAFYARIPVGHVEAGLRTYDLSQPFPEELNRQVIARIASRHFAPTPRSRDFLISEGLGPSTVVLTGNTVVDALRLMMQTRIHSVETELDQQQQPGFLVTMHRRENHGEIQRVYEAAFRLAEMFPKFVCTIVTHPNPAVVAAQRSMRAAPANVEWSPPMSYPEFLAKLDRATLVITDSGGVQEEAVSLGKPVVVARARTERQEGQEAGLAILCGCNTDAIVKESKRIIDIGVGHTTGRDVYGDGRAAHRIAESILDFLRARS